MTRTTRMQDLSPIDLQLDPDNPRFTESERGGSQAETLRLLIDRFKLEELAESILASGYLTFDPLVGFPSDDKSSVVIAEGNRRVATLKLLLDPTLVTDQRRRAKWTDFASRLSNAQKRQISKVAVEVFGTRDDHDLSAYIGFRHVTGVLKWPAYEKAGFISALVMHHDWDYKRVADRLGSYAKYVERHHIAHTMVRQAHEQNVPGSTQMENRFGVLLRALNSSGINEFLGIQCTGDPQSSPVRAGEERFREFVKWTFGTDKLDPVVTDSRQLSRWGKILESSNAIRYLRSTDDPEFDRAWQKAGGEVQTVGDSLYTAADRLEEVVALVSEHQDNTRVVEGVGQCARFMSQILAHFPNVKTKYFGDD